MAYRNIVFALLVPRLCLTTPTSALAGRCPRQEHWHSYAIRSSRSSSSSNSSRGNEPAVEIKQQPLTSSSGDGSRVGLVEAGPSAAAAAVLKVQVAILVAAGAVCSV